MDRVRIMCISDFGRLKRGQDARDTAMELGPIFSNKRLKAALWGLSAILVLAGCMPKGPESGDRYNLLRRTYQSPFSWN